MKAHEFLFGSEAWHGIFPLALGIGALALGLRSFTKSYESAKKKHEA